jgi:ADP-ribosylglycohydrolase
LPWCHRKASFLQVTDDSEMALCMAQALVDTPASSRAVPLDMVAAWYGKWLHSPPFDIGEQLTGTQQQQQQPRSSSSTQQQHAARSSSGFIPTLSLHSEQLGCLAVGCSAHPSGLAQGLVGP